MLFFNEKKEKESESESAHVRTQYSCTCYRLMMIISRKYRAHSCHLRRKSGRPVLATSTCNFRRARARDHVILTTKQTSNHVELTCAGETCADDNRNIFPVDQQVPGKSVARRKSWIKFARPPRRSIMCRMRGRINSDATRRDGSLKAADCPISGLNIFALTIEIPPACRTALGWRSFFDDIDNIIRPSANRAAISENMNPTPISLSYSVFIKFRYIHYDDFHDK